MPKISDGLFSQKILGINLVANILYEYLPKRDKNIDLNSCLILSKDYFGDLKHFGKIKYPVILKFFNWLKEKNVENQFLNVRDLFVELNF